MQQRSGLHQIFINELRGAITKYYRELLRSEGGRSSFYKIAKMKKLLSLGLLFLTISCGKNNEAGLTACDQQMIAKFKGVITCPFNPKMSTYLVKGKYEGEVVYYLAVICAVCQVVPTDKVYNCAGVEIQMPDLNAVADKTTVNACGGR
ncbi:MAG: hypothetical protein J7539_04965 [Niabella sp.]|nr:hypothetical protein [Niabella sp.]